MLNNFFFPKSRSLRDSVEEYCGVRGATNDVTIWRTRVACWIREATCMHANAGAYAVGRPHARSVAHTEKYVTLHCFSTTVMVSRTRLNITLYVHCLSYCITKICFHYLKFSGTKKNTAIFWCKVS
jgi:hypothetical protein